MRHLILPLAAAAMLAACSSDDSGNNASDSGAGGAVQEAAPANLSDDTQNSLVPVSLPSPTPLTAFPEAYQGRWGMTANDCDPKQDFAAKGLMVIGSTSLTFYESRATIDTLKQASPGRVTADLSFSGEGQKWRRAESLTIQDDGKTLVRDEQDPAASFTYSRCPA